jgi:hypothetical protein
MSAGRPRRRSISPIERNTVTTITRTIALSVLTLLAAGVLVIQPAGAAAPIKKCGNLPSQAAYASPRSQSRATRTSSVSLRP